MIAARRAGSLCATGGALGLLLLALAGPASAVRADESLDVRLVTVPLAAVDSEGHPIAGLERDQIELRRDGELIEVIALTPADGAGAAIALATEPRGGSFVLYVDTLFLEPGMLAAVVPALERLLGDGLPAAVRTVVIAADRDGVRPLPSPDEAAAAAASLAEVAAPPIPARSLTEARDIERDIERALGGGGRQVLRVRDALPDLLLERISSLAEQSGDEVATQVERLAATLPTIAGLPGPVDLLYVGGAPPTGLAAGLYRRWLGAFGPNSAYAAAGSSDGEGTGAGTGRGEQGFSTGATAFSGLAAPTPSFNPSDLWEPLVETALLAGVRVHTLALATGAPGGTTIGSASGGVIGPAGSATGPALDLDATSDPTAARPLAALARATGGLPLAGRAGIDDELASLSGLLAASYRLTFLDSDAPSGTRHQLAIRLPGAGSQIELSYPRAYVHKSVDQISAEKARTALRFGITDNPFEISLRTVAGQADGKEIVELSVEVPAARLALATERRAHTGQISIFAAAGSWEGESEVRKAVVPLRIDHRDLMTALGRRVEYGFSIPRPASAERLVVAVRDDLALLTSTVVVPLPPAIGSEGP